jgi:hypothetical protein
MNGTHNIATKAVLQEYTIPMIIDTKSAHIASEKLARPSALAPLMV